MRWFWIDRFTAFVSGLSATAVKNVSLAEEHLHDHFPGHPVMPGSLIVEGMAQTGGLLISEYFHFRELIVLGKVAKFELFDSAGPGDQITYHCKVEQIKDGGALVTASAQVEDRNLAAAEIFFARMDNPAGASRGSHPNRRVLLNWLSIVGVFQVGRTQDGRRLSPEMYGFA